MNALEERYGLMAQLHRRGVSAPNQVLHTHGYREFFDRAYVAGRSVARLAASDLAIVRAQVLEHITAYSRRQRGWFRKLDMRPAPPSFALVKQHVCRLVQANATSRTSVR